MEHFIKFRQYAIAYMEANRLGLEGTDQPSEAFIGNLKNTIIESKLFTLSDETKKLLMLTTPPNKNEPVKLPFPNMFIDVHFSKEEAHHFGYEIEGDITGIGIMKGSLINANGGDDEREVGETLRMTYFLHKKDEGRVIFDTASRNFLVTNELFKDAKIVSEPSEIGKKTKNFVHMFAVNLLNLVNDPEIVLVERKEDSERNAKRAKRGKLPIPASANIRLDGKRKIYVDKLIANGSFTYSHQFWVRGTYKHFRSDRYKKAKGTKKWVEPFLKGTGILVEKEYKVDKHD